MIQATGDDEFLKANLDSMSKEFDFWMTKRIIDMEKDGKTYTLARYNVEVDLPRPGKQVLFTDRQKNRKDENTKFYAR